MRDPNKRGFGKRVYTFFTGAIFLFILAPFYGSFYNWFFEGHVLKFTLPSLTFEQGELYFVGKEEVNLILSVIVILLFAIQIALARIYKDSSFSINFRQSFRAVFGFNVGIVFGLYLTVWAFIFSWTGGASWLSPPSFDVIYLVGMLYLLNSFFSFCELFKKNNLQ